MKIFIVLSVLFVFIFLIITLVSWTVHLSMVKGCYRLKYGKGNYKVFLREFNLVEWKTNKLYRQSLFSKDNLNTQIHASIFEFNGNAMYFGYFDYLRVQYFLLANRRKYFKFDDSQEFVWT